MAQKWRTWLPKDLFASLFGFNRQQEAHKGQLNIHMVAITPCPWPLLSPGYGGRAGDYTQLHMAQQHQR